MRHAVCLALLAPIVALAAGAVDPRPVVAPGVSLKVVNTPVGDGASGPPGPQSRLEPARPARFTVGTVDTIGGTTYDYGTNGPAYRMLIASPGKGVHVLFMYSASSDTLFADRNLRYNFYDFGTHAWNWTDPDFMQAGVNVFAERTGYGNIDVAANGAAVISAHHRTGSGNADFAPIVARDAEAGAGIFDYAPGESSGLNYNEWPYLAMTDNGTYQLAMIDANNQDDLKWSRMTTWGTWEALMSIPSPQPEPLSPTHNITTSHVSGSNKVCLTWVGTPASGYQQDPGFYRESQDGGSNWDAPVEIGFPVTFHPGSETVPSYDVSSLFPFYDHNNNLHIVGNVTPFVRDTNWVLPGQLWHWCTANPDTWNLIHVASPDSWMASCGGHAVVCCRPSLGEDGNGNLFVAWEEFDGANVEPTTSRLRADIWYSYSSDNGRTWQGGVKLTDGGDVTYRFPSILNPIGDTVMVAYMIDQVAGFFVQSAEGAASYNPVVVQKWFNPTAIAEGPTPALPARMELAAGPNPARGRTEISYSLPRAGAMSLVVYDAVGRPVQTLAAGHWAAGRYNATWSAAGASAGIYFCTLESGGHSTSRKLILTD
jgi:hypothetical protein